MLLNHFTQSTAAELSVFLFYELCEKFPGVKPMIVVHDALIVEVPNLELTEFVAAANNLSFLEQPFPITISELA